MPISAIGRFGVKIDAPDLPVNRLAGPSSFRVGEAVELEGDGSAMFVKAASAITGEGYVCVVDKDGNADMISTVNSNSKRGRIVGVAQCALAANQYGWLVTRGSSLVRVAASAAANTELNVTATAGQLDDDATVTSEVIDGVVLDVANGVAAGLVAARLFDTRVGRSL